MHNVIPHVHSEAPVIPAHQSGQHGEEALLDFLVNSFQLDFGEGHLECYSQAEGPSFAGLSALALLTPCPFYQRSVTRDFTFFPVKELVPKARNEILVSRDDDTGSPLRAPPVFA